MMSENGSQYIYQQQTDGSKSFEKWKKGRGVSHNSKYSCERERLNIHFYSMKLKGKKTTSFDLKSED